MTAPTIAPGTPIESPEMQAHLAALLAHLDQMGARDDDAVELPWGMQVLGSLVVFNFADGTETWTAPDGIAGLAVVEAYALCRQVAAKVASTRHGK